MNSPASLTTARLLLRPFELGDAAVVQRLAGDPEVALTTQNIPHPYEDGMAEEWIASHLAAWEAKRLLALAVTTAAEGLVGAVSLTITAAHRRGELGYWIGRPYWNRGYATEAAAAVVDFGLEELGLYRIQARHLTRNPASGRVMQKIGMVREGILRKHIVVRGQIEDVVMYSILVTDR